MKLTSKARWIAVGAVGLFFFICAHRVQASSRVNVVGTSVEPNAPRESNAPISIISACMGAGALIQLNRKK